MAPDKAELLKETIGLVLHNQFVLPDGLGELYRCIKGPGMGLSHSGHLANSSFYVSVEKPYFATNLEGLLCWLRLFDDILAVWDSRQSMLRDMAWFRTNSMHLNMKAGMHSSEEVQFLDLTVQKTKSKLSAFHTLDKLSVPLSPISIHNHAIHCSWPRVCAKRVQQLAKGSKSKECLQKLRSNYEKAGAHELMLSRLQCEHNKPKTKPSTLWCVRYCVCRFHNVFHSALNRAIFVVPVPSHWNLQLSLLGPMRSHACRMISFNTTMKLARPSLKTTSMLRVWTSGWVHRRRLCLRMLRVSDTNSHTSYGMWTNSLLLLCVLFRVQVARERVGVDYQSSMRGLYHVKGIRTAYVRRSFIVERHAQRCVNWGPRN